MPSTLSQLFFPGRGSYKLTEERVSKRVARSRSFTIMSKQKNSELTEVSSSDDSTPAQKYTNLSSPLHKLSALSHRRRNFASRRHKTVNETSEPIVSLNDENHNISLKNRISFERCETDRPRKSSFREVTKHLVPGLLSRSSSFGSERKQKLSRSQTQPVSPLVTGSKKGSLVRAQTDDSNMGRMVSNDVIAGTNGSRVEESHPASVESFVRKCADCFDSTGLCSNEHFLRILFLTHQWFMTSEQLMVLFTKLYEEEKCTEGYSKKVFQTIRFWMKEFPHMFDLDQNLVNALRHLQEISLTDPDVDTTLIDLNNKDSYKWIAQLSQRPNYIDRKQRKVSLIFNHLEPEELAIHMSYLEYNSFRRLTLSDFHNYAAHGVIKDNVRLERAVFLFNNITHWVQCMVLDHHKTNDRALAIVKFVEVAKKLHSMRNFNTLMAIVGALTHTAISRLKKTMSEVPKSTQKTLDEFVELLDSKYNYTCYRRAYKSVTENFKIPVIGILMKDLTALHAALPDRVGDGLINVRKMMKIGSKFEEIFQLQRVGFPYTVNRDLVNTLRVSLYLYYNEEEIYQLSVTREPRDIKYSSSGLNASPTKTVNMGFAEFASFTCQLDDDTIKEHVTAMVGSVFKAYDQNSDGFISEAEFGSFIKNFPGLDSFAIVDQDQDGRISKSEMVDYFLKISSTRRNQVCQSFKHVFTETTYFHPTFCEDCDRLLWGLVKQGWKCKDCGINCHKHCKDRIVQECRPKSDPKHTNSTSSSHKKREKRKEKASLSSESDLSINGDNPRVSPTNDEDPFEHSDSKTNLTETKKKRIASLAAHASTTKASQQPFAKRRAKTTSVASIALKPSSPTGGAESYCKKFRPFNILTKKNSPRLTEKSPSSPKATRFLHANILYKKAHSFEDVSDPKAREKLKKELEKRMAKRKKSESSKSNHTSESEQAITDLNSYSNKNNVEKLRRQDSGVSSSCSYIPTPSASTPDTPLCNDHTCRELKFQYPPSSVPPTILTPPSKAEPADISTNKDKKGMFDENERLHQENEVLRCQLQQANDVIKELETKLTNLQPTS